MRRGISRATVLMFLVVDTLAAHVSRAVSPVVIQPNFQNQWTLGGVETVVRVTDGLNVTGVNGTLLMGFTYTNGSVFLWKDQPLAENFPLADGAVNVRCPLNLPTSSRYVVALLGDENNLSGAFSVEDANSIFSSSTIVLPAALATTGNVPSATITRSSVVGTIPPPASTMSQVPTNGASSPVTSSGVATATGASQSHNAAQRCWESRNPVRAVFGLLTLFLGISLV
ncbi:hypothetical protein C8Q79DRAFT_529581 [Trametes meyenii]|nr:hypothetical protein C8Q79DRAFT_529581 [Trametes meyenii]